MHGSSGNPDGSRPALEIATFVVVACEVLDHCVSFAAGLNALRHLRPDHAGQVRVLRKVLLCAPVVRMAVQV